MSSSSVCVPIRAAELVDLTTQPLPPLPEPDRRGQRAQAIGGILLVVGLVALFVASTCGAVASGMEPSELGTAFVGLIVSQGVLAFIALVGLLNGDAGVIRRTPTTVQPMPEEVASRLADGAPLRDDIDPMNGMSNIREGSRSYCVRCFVWREHEAPPSALRILFRRLSGHPDRMQRVDVRVHHCRMCNRCVRFFDHHCGVFGRCIAGRGFEGNLKYFLSLIALAYTGGITCTVALVYRFVSGFLSISGAARA